MEVFIMKLRRFEELVNYAVSGNMKQEEVSTIVVKLKNEKASIMSELYAMPDSDERRQYFNKLHSQMYRLYQAVVFVREERNSKTGEVEIICRKADSIANMVLCYDVPRNSECIKLSEVA